MTKKPYHKPTQCSTPIYAGRWQDWPTWVIDQWWEERVRGRKQNRYGYEKRVVP